MRYVAAAVHHHQPHPLALQWVLSCLWSINETLQGREGLQLEPLDLPAVLEDFILISQAEQDALDEARLEAERQRQIAEVL